MGMYIPQHLKENIFDESQQQKSLLLMPVLI